MPIAPGIKVTIAVTGTAVPLAASSTNATARKSPCLMVTSFAGDHPAFVAPSGVGRHLKILHPGMAGPPVID